MCGKKGKNGQPYLANKYEFKFANRNTGEPKPENTRWAYIKDKNGKETKNKIYDNGIVERNGFFTKGSLNVNHYTFNGLDVKYLVATNFIPPPERKDQTTVNHKDRNTKNNHHSNLEWANAREQILHSYATNTERKNSSFKRKCKYRHKDSENWTECESIRNAGRKTNISESSIRKCIDKETFINNYEFQSIGIKFDPNKILKPAMYYIEIDDIEEFKRINEIDDSIETIFT